MLKIDLKIVELYKNLAKLGLSIILKIKLR